MLAASSEASASIGHAAVSSGAEGIEREVLRVHEDCDGEHGELHMCGNDVCTLAMWAQDRVLRLERSRGVICEAAQRSGTVCSHYGQHTLQKRRRTEKCSTLTNWMTYAFDRERDLSVTREDRPTGLM
jgi:hypothetical protein